MRLFWIHITRMCTLLHSHVRAHSIQIRIRRSSTNGCVSIVGLMVQTMHCVVPARLCAFVCMRASKCARFLPGRSVALALSLSLSLSFLSFLAVLCSATKLHLRSDCIPLSLFFVARRTHAFCCQLFILLQSGSYERREHEVSLQIYFIFLSAFWFSATDQQSRLKSTVFISHQNFLWSNQITKTHQQSGKWWVRWFFNNCYRRHYHHTGSMWYNAFARQKKSHWITTAVTIIFGKSSHFPFM